MSLSRKKILFVIPSLSGGGAERVFSTLLDHLDRSQFEIHLALLDVQASGSQEIPPDVLIHHLKYSRVRRALPGLVKLVWKLRPDALLSTLGHLNLALIAARPLLPARIKVLVRETTIASVLLQDGIRYAWAWRWLYRGLYRHADWVVCPSGAILEDLARNFGVPREKLVCIYNPVDVDKVCSFAESGGSPYNGRGPYLITAGRLSREKGLDLLLDAMPEILQSFPDVQLTLLGEGPAFASLLEQSRRLGLTDHVRFAGFQDNPWRYIRYADIFVLPSRFEGLPNALLEAIALGTPVVATDCAGSIREILDYDKTIVLVPPDDVNELAKAIIAACQAPGAQPAEARVRLRQFDLQQAVEAYSRLLADESL